MDVDIVPLSPPLDGFSGFPQKDPREILLWGGRMVRALASPEVLQVIVPKLVDREFLRHAAIRTFSGIARQKAVTVHG